MPKLYPRRYLIFLFLLMRSQSSIFQSQSVSHLSAVVHLPRNNFHQKASENREVVKEEEEKDEEEEEEEEKEKEKEKGIVKDGPGPVMVSDTLCPAVHILGT